MAMVRMLGMDGTLGLRTFVVLRRTVGVLVLMLDSVMNVLFRRMRRAGDGAERP